MVGDVAVASVVLWRELLAEAAEFLAGAGVASADVEARRIVVAAACCDDAAWHSELDRPATRRGVASFDRMLARRTAGEPLQYVLGAWGFRALDLFVDRRVLIPRPETEVTAGCALAELRRRAHESGGRGGVPLRSFTQAKVVAARPPAPPPPGSGDGTPTLLAADLGCGSGAIGLSLAAERVDVEVICTDVSADALAVASANLAGLGRPARRVQLLEGSWYKALPPQTRGRFDVIASNPPYVAAGSDSLPREIADYEPPVALYSGPAGMEATEEILAGAPEWLAPGGALVLEMADGAAARVTRLARSAGLAEVAVHPDLAGADRVLVARRPA
ncbi:MAG: peptide chain release factor N(5)-glutamine methyltransferase [bacterium]|nr:peptide chain release factor N(5)-glutamine methyltransferase [bacterium]